MALAPAGGWAAGDESFKQTLAFFPTMQVKAIAPQADTAMSSPDSRRRATQFITTNGAS